ncbi:hypothetical protein F5Y10DRAFT_268752 [Nemania abortiva]|nr:hypothetical protein F5Y10DRAFT_268752 [Nemania abortiva]
MSYEVNERVRTVFNTVAIFFMDFTEFLFGKVAGLLGPMAVSFMGHVAQARLTEFGN